MSADPYEIPIRKTVNKLRRTLAIGVPLLVVGLLIGLMAKIYSTATQQWARVACASNLRQIGTGLQLYASNNHDQLPRGLYNPATADKPTAFSQPNNAGGGLFAQDSAPVNDVTVPFYQMLRTGDLPAGAYCCPFAGPLRWQVTSEDLPRYNNIPNSNHIAYSLNNPYLKSDDPAARDSWWMHKATGAQNTVIAADMNPGTPDLLKLTPQSSERQMRKGNSRNHRGAGQNVLFSDGHVEWLNTPFYDEVSLRTNPPGPISPTADNIYTYGTGLNQGIIGSSTGTEDAILLPTANMK